MSNSLKRKTNLSTVQETPVADNYFRSDLLPGRCRKEFSPGYKEHVLQTEISPKVFPVLNGSLVHHIDPFSIPATRRQRNKFLFGIIGNISRFFLQYPLRQAIVYADTVAENYTGAGKPIRSEYN